MTEESSERSPERNGLARREVLGATGAAALAAWAGCQQVSPQSTDGDAPPGSHRAEEESTTLELEPALDLGGRLIVAAPDEIGYDTVAAAYEAAADGDVVYVHGSYDAQAAGEPFPIVLDYTEKEVVLAGGHPSGSVVDASHTSENAVEVLGKGHADYRNNALVQHLKIVGGDVGLRIRGAPYASFKDLVVYRAATDGVSVEPYTDAGGDLHGSFGITFRNVMAWRCGECGFCLESGAHPHSTTFYGCDALFNGFESGRPGVQLRGYSSRWMNGTVQNNGGYGIDARAGPSQAVTEVYFEGNGMAAESPHDVFVGDSAPGFTLQGSYFQGGYYREAPNGRSRAARGVAVAGAEGTELAACTYTNYDDAFAHLRQTRDADVHVPSHTALDGTRFQHSWNNTRLRSDGTVLPTDLRGRDPPGRFAGDSGVHDGSGDAPWGPATWDGSAWISVVDGDPVR